MMMIIIIIVIIIIIIIIMKLVCKEFWGDVAQESRWRGTVKMDQRSKGPRDGREKINKWKTNGKKSQCMGNMLATYWELGENMALAGA